MFDTVSVFENRFDTVIAFDTYILPPTWSVVKPCVYTPPMVTLPVAYTLVVKTLVVVRAFAANKFPVVYKLLTVTFVGMITFDDIYLLMRNYFW